MGASPPIGGPASPAPPIPETATPPLEWLIDRYRLTRDRESGIVNDPNAWFADPCDLPAAIRRIVHVSIETTRLVAALPKAVDIDPRADSDMFDFQAEAHRQSPLATTADRSDECR